MPPGEVDLLFDPIEIVEQPFGGRRDVPAPAHGEGRVIERPENVLVLAQPREQPVFSMPRDHLMTGGECLGVARKLFHAEQLRPQRRLARAGARTRLAGHPVLKAQWQSLHIIPTSVRDSRHSPARRNWPPAGSPAGSEADWTAFSSDAGVSQAQ